MSFSLEQSGAPALLSLAAILQWVDTRDLRESDCIAEAQLLSPPLAADSHLFEIMHAFEHVEIYPRLECDATNIEEDMPLIRTRPSTRCIRLVHSRKGHAI